MPAKITFRPAWDFLRTASDCQTLEALDEGFSTALKPFEFDGFSCAFAQTSAASDMEAKLLFGRSNQDWDSYYFASGYLEYDPCIPQLLSSSHPFSWADMQMRSESPMARQMWSEASEAGLNSGFVIPIPGDKEDELYGVRLMSPARRFDQDARPVLNALAITYCVHGIKLLESAKTAGTDRSPLSKREAECLAWVTEGKSDWDISEILNISQWTVHEHIERAKSKLGVRSRIQAAMLSSMNGWLNVNPSR